MKRRSGAILALFVALLCAMLAPMAPARAASAYDNTVQIGESVVGRSVGSVWTEVDISATYMQIWEADAQNDSACASQLQSFRNAVSNGGSWYISQQRKEGTSAFKRVFIAWSQTPDAPIGFTSYLYPSNPSTAYTALRPTITGTWASSGWNEVSFDLISSGSSAGQVDVSCPSVVQYGMVARHHYNRSSNAHDIRPILVHASVQYPSGYEGVVIPDTWSPPASTYVAMGDSFSSGEGNPPFEGVSDANGCHRSSAAYPRLLESELGEANFVACSGATTADVINGKNGEPSQLNALSEDTEVVTITVGGNDAGFGRVIRQCADPNSEPLNQNLEEKCENAIGEAWEYLADDGLYNDLYWVFEALQYETGSQTAIYVGGYANPFPVDNGTFCYWGVDYMNNVVWPPEFIVRSVTSFERAEFAALTTEINSQIAAAVSEYSKLEFVDVQATFVGHDACSQEPWFNAIEYPENQEYSYHPNAAGQQAYAELFASAFSD